MTDSEEERARAIDSSEHTVGKRPTISSRPRRLAAYLRLDILLRVNAEES